MDALSRRTVLAALAATLAAGASPAVAIGSSPPPATVTEIIPLYVHHQCGGLLCFGKQYDDFSDMPAWTWRRRFARDYMGDYRAQELDADALAYAKEEFSFQADVDADELDENAFKRWLEEPIPGGEDSDEVEWWMDHEGPVGQAAQLVDLLGVVTPKGFEDGIGINHFPFFGALVDEAGLDRLRTAVAASGLPIEIIETR